MSGRAKVEKSMNDTRPDLPYDEAMAFINAELERRKTARTAASWRQYLGKI